MKKQMIFVLTAAAVTICAEKISFVVPADSTLTLYSSQELKSGAKPVCTASKTEILKITKESGSLVQLENSKGIKGWTEKALTVPASSTSEQFAEQNVVGRTADSPEVITAPDQQQPAEALIPERSFTDKLKVDQSKESLTN